MQASPDASGHAVLEALALARPRATLVLNGGTAALPGALRDRLSIVLAAASALARRERLTVVTGGTDAGIFALYGDGVRGLTAPLVGVAPAGLVAPAIEAGDTGRGADGDAVKPDRVPLEPSHSHHVLVEAERWGDETPVMLALLAALDRHGPSAALLVGGGAGAALEVAGHVQAGRPVLALGGSGRLADDIARCRDGAVEAGVAAALAASPLVKVIDLADGPGAVVSELRRLLGLAGPPSPPTGVR